MRSLVVLPAHSRQMRISSLFAPSADQTERSAWECISRPVTAEEQRVLNLRDETIARHRLELDCARASHPAATRARKRAFEYQLLRLIALDHPALTPVVWRMLGMLNQAA